MDRQTDRGTAWETEAHIVAWMLGPISLESVHTRGKGKQNGKGRK